MKSAKIIFWISTTLLALFMLFSGVNEIINNADGIKFMATLGYPKYLNPFLGVTKILGVIAIVVPGFPRLKEWAYAGFAIDFIGAGYSFIATNQQGGAIFMLVPLAFLFISYIAYHKRLQVVA